MSSLMAPSQREGTPYPIPAPQQCGVPSRGRGGVRGGVAGQQGGPSVSVSFEQAVAAFGSIKTGCLPMETRARIINAPELQYASGFTQGTARPRDEDWTLVDKPMSLCSWIVVIFVPPNQFSAEDAKRTITDLVQGCEAIGMQVPEKQPLFVYKNPHDNVDQSIMEALTQTTNERKTALTFLVCIVPDGINADLYTAVKHCGDIKSGVANQCLKAGKCKDARRQYWANVALKINAKLGGVNVIPDPKSAPIISQAADIKLG